MNYSYCIMICILIHMCFIHMQMYELKSSLFPLLFPPHNCLLPCYRSLRRCPLVSSSI